MSMARICITMGDPAGIGPEIILKAAAALTRDAGADSPRLVVAGSRPVFREVAESLGLQSLDALVQEGSVDWTRLPGEPLPGAEGRVNGRRHLNGERVAVDI